MYCRDDSNLCQSEFCQSLPIDSDLNRDANKPCIDKFLTLKSSMAVLTRETRETTIVKCIEKFAKPITVLYRTETSTNLRNCYELRKP